MARWWRSENLFVLTLRMCPELRRRLVTVAIGLVAALSTACQSAQSSATATDASASASTSTAPNHPSLTETFNSPLMGYSVRYPAGWTATPATDLWVPDAPNYWDDPVGDRLENSNTGFRGRRSHLRLNGCAGQGRLGGKVFDLVVVSGHRGYNFTMEGNVARDFFLATLATVKFDPDSAKMSG